jgi:sugar lactone lactonase YvrE
MKMKASTLLQCALVLFALSSACNCQTLTVTTLAGSPTGAIGFANAAGTSALFNSPAGVCVDSSGVVYVADQTNHAIRKITGGVVTTLAGSSTFGYTNAVGTSAGFHNPSSCAVDSAGNVYVADSANSAVRKISPTGSVSTLAGSAAGTVGFANGVGTSATFRNLNGVAVDAAGNVYVADLNNHAIRKVTPSGTVTTLAGSGSSGFVNGVGAAATFNQPFNVAVDAAGSVVYVADFGNHAIRKIETATGTVTTYAGGVTGFTNGVGASAQFKSPPGVALDAAGVVYVADYGNNVIRMIAVGGAVTTLAGSTAGVAGFANGVGTSATFRSPIGVAADAAGTLYVADSSNNAIRTIALTGSSPSAAPPPISPPPISPPPISPPLLRPPPSPRSPPPPAKSLPPRALSPPPFAKSPPARRPPKQAAASSHVVAGGRKLAADDLSEATAAADSAAASISSVFLVVVALVAGAAFH